MGLRQEVSERVQAAGRSRAVVGARRGRGWERGGAGRAERTQVRQVRRVCPGRLGSLDCPPSWRRHASEGRGAAGRRVAGPGKEGQKSDKGPKGAGGRQTPQLQDSYNILLLY